MRIDEVIVNEAPVGLGQRAMNFVQSKIGTAGSKARGQGKRDTATLANNLNTKMQQELAKRGLTPKTGEGALEAFDPEYASGVIKYLGQFFDKGLMNTMSKAFTKEWQALNDKSGQGEAYTLTDKFIMDLYQNSLKSNKPITGIANPTDQTGGDGAGAGAGASAGGGAGAAPGTPEAQAIAAVDKLADSQKQAIIQHLTQGQPKTA